MTSPSSSHVDRHTPPVIPTLATPGLEATDVTPKRSSRHFSFHNDRSVSNPLDQYTDFSPEHSLGTAGRRALRKPSPGLLARMKLLDLRHKTRSVSNPGQEVGRIPHNQLKELDSLHQDQSIKVEKRGRAWSRKSGVHPAGNGLPERGMESSDFLGPLVHESDHSSIISVSDRMVHSDYDDSETDVLENDNLKYRLPDVGKSRGSSISISRGATETYQVQNGSRPPTPPPKDTPPDTTPNEPSPEPTLDLHQMGLFSPDEPQLTDSYFNPHGLSRAGSIYTLSRVSFTNQISQLTSIKLPDAESLSSSISSLPTSNYAARALNEAAGQIKIWVAKASEVLNGLDAEDDVEWSAAAGREGLDEVDAAIQVFESLIRVFVVAIEELQTRDDIGNLSTKELTRLVEAMESILNDWARIKRKLQGVKEQVEIAMEWEELWNTVLGEIGLEVEALSRLVFEMEERRHRSVMAESITENSNGLDIESLETIVEETPPNNKPVLNNRFSLPTSFAATPVQLPSTSHEDANLLALFARMQPLRASLDFLPMRLAPFQMRGAEVFPSACDELDNRRQTLENQWMKLERDAESLRRELGEDRWVLVFRNAGRQAQKMCESVKRSIIKLEEALDSGAQHTDLPATAKKIESFQAKKMHYGPAIERVLMIIDKGVKDRLTVNGEILRLQADMRREWAGLEVEMKDMEQRIEELNMNKSQHLRDSISTILSTERSVSSSAVDTPGSSPASSVVLMSRKEREQEQRMAYKSRQSSFTSNQSLPTPNKRYSSLPVVSGGSHTIPRKPVSRYGGAEPTSSPGNHRYSLATPTPNRMSRVIPTPSSQPTKPRWNGSTNLNDTAIGHNFKPMSATTPSPYRKGAVPPRTLRPSASNSNLRRANTSSPPPSALPRPASTTPAPSKRQSVIGTMAPHTPSRAGNSNNRLAVRTSSSSALPTPSSTIMSRRRSGLLEPMSVAEDEAVESECPSPVSSRKLSTPAPPPRAASAMAGRRSSMLPQPKTPSRPGYERGLTAPTGRDSRAESRAASRTGSRAQSRADSRAGGRMSSLDNRPRWRH